jgi:hypothetical protein
MCSEIQTHALNWPLAKLNRWIGFVQTGILANRILRLDQIKAMFDGLKQRQPQADVDQDLLDHLDLQQTFELELGGQG